MAKLGFSTTALQALRGADLKGKVAIVTGGNSGIGTETVRALATAGAAVVMTSRSTEAGESVVAQLKATGVQGSISVMQLDLASLRSVRAFAAAFQAAHPRLDLLVLNAGVMACPEATTQDGFELQIGTNHFGHFALTQLLVERMKAQAFPSRVVVVSSEIHGLGNIVLEDLHFRQRKYKTWAAYSQSKLANILFARDLARRLQGSQVSAFGLQPGIIPTNLMRHYPMVSTLFSALGRFMWVFGIRSVEQGAATTVYAAVAPELEGHSGAFLFNCAIFQPNKKALDDDLARKLWEVTEDQLKEAWAKVPPEAAQA